MNTILNSHTHYLRPSRTIETLLITNGKRQKTVYVYNYEGYHFRIFFSIQQITAFFDGHFEPPASFDDELSLDDFLCNNLGFETIGNSSENTPE
jgi:hypothetical protein